MPGGGYSPLRNDGATPHDEADIEALTNNRGSIVRGDEGYDQGINPQPSLREDDANNNAHREMGVAQNKNSSNSSTSEDRSTPSLQDSFITSSKPHRQTPSLSLPAPNRKDARGSNYRTQSRGSSNTTRYTAMRPTNVQEHNYPDQDHSDSEYPDDVPSDPDDLVFYNSQVRITVDSPNSSKKKRFNVVLCGLLTACLATVGFGLLYVFVILPARKGNIVTPGGVPPYKLKHLDVNEAVTSCGIVRGTFEDGAHVFRGIPYAYPPTGSRRWMPPVPLSYKFESCWDDTLDTTKFKNACAQPSVKNNATTNNNGDSHSHSDFVGSEDCLYLNVWTPSTNPSKLLPVLVWIHSGDFVFGSGHARGMSPTSRLAVNTNAVYVSFNFRLGVFGFLSLDVLRERKESPRGATGNYGIMDQQAALHWVKQNIQRFGGDPKKITVFGHGSGATSIEALLLSPSSIGLFSSAWLTSPVALLNKTTTEASTENVPIMTTAHCSTAACLRAMDTQSLLQLWPTSRDPYWTMDQILTTREHTQRRNNLAIVDGHVLHWSSIKHGPRGPVVPVVIGTTYSDLSELKTKTSIFNMTWHDLEMALIHHLSPLGTEATQQIKSHYLQGAQVEHIKGSSRNLKSTTDTLSEPGLQYARFVRDIQTVCPVKMLADGLSTMYVNSAPVYLYISEAYPSQKLKLRTQSQSAASNQFSTDSVFLGWDMIAFFGSFEEFGITEQQSDISFQDIVRQELMSLARNGKPNAARWSTEEVNTGILRSEVTVSPAPKDYFDKCDVFKQFGFFHYTWSDN